MSPLQSAGEAPSHSPHGASPGSTLHSHVPVGVITHTLIPFHILVQLLNVITGGSSHLRDFTLAPLLTTLSFCCTTAQGIIVLCSFSYKSRVRMLCTNHEFTKYDASLRHQTVF